MEPQQDVPFMRSSATVRRKPSLPDSRNSLSPEKAGLSFSNIFSSGPFTHEPQSSFKVGSHLSGDPSSAIDRQLGLLAVEAVTRNQTSAQDPSARPHRMRPDLPDPRKLRKRVTKADNMKRQRHSLNMSEHIAQLKHICLDYNWGKPTVEIKNKHKPEEAVATVRRRSLKTTAYDTVISSWVPTRVGDYTHRHTASSTSTLHLEDDTNDSMELEIQRWDVGAGISHLEPDIEEIPSYLHPPSKPSFQHQQQQPKIAQIPDVPDVPSYPENPFFQSYLDGDEHLTARPHFDPAFSLDRNSRWDQFIMQQED